MEQYQSMAKSIEGLKKPIVHIALISVLAHLIILGTGILLNREGNRNEFSTFETCLYGMDILFKNGQDEKLFHKDVLKATKEHQFKIDEINLIKVIDGHHCDVIAKDAKGYRSYRVTLEKNSKFPHLYRIFDIRGQKLTSPYQWRSKI